jgi:hypothetical protein
VVAWRGRHRNTPTCIGMYVCLSLHFLSLEASVLIHQTSIPSARTVSLTAGISAFERLLYKRSLVYNIVHPNPSRSNTPYLIVIIEFKYIITLFTVARIIVRGTCVYLIKLSSSHVLFVRIIQHRSALLPLLVDFCVLRHGGTGTT